MARTRKKDPKPKPRDPRKRPLQVKNLISRKKETYPIFPPFREYLDHYGRLYQEGVRYQDLLRYEESIPLYDERGNDTFWATVFYPQIEMREIHDRLRMTYAILKASGDISIAQHLYVDRIDLCLYGNTSPFRIRIVNRLNDNFDYFYVKRVDANRVYGLELEHILSPNRINYFLHENSIIEEHVIGMPGDAFMRETMPESKFDLVRLAKEFVKFNERTFLRLLGDMHSGNFVIDVTRDFEKWHYRLRPIDFDQQSHHWRKQVYLPQFFPQNNAIIKVGLKYLTHETVRQYQKEEHALIANRVRVSRTRFEALMHAMCQDEISERESVLRLGAQLAEHYEWNVFERARTMGHLVYASLSSLFRGKTPAAALNLERETFHAG